MKIVFLDFDGPIIPEASHLHHRLAEEKAWPPCIAALNHITESTGAQIVVSSAWRAGGLAEMQNLLKSWGAKAKVAGMTPVIYKSNPDNTAAHFPTRGEEIAEYLKKNPKVESFVILDDDNDMDQLKPYLVQTPFSTGITEKHANQAIKILNNFSTD
jgi:hypothetical protein